MPTKLMWNFGAWFFKRLTSHLKSIDLWFTIMYCITIYFAKIYRMLNRISSSLSWNFYWTAGTRSTRFCWLYFLNPNFKTWPMGETGYGLFSQDKVFISVNSIYLLEGALIYRFKGSKKGSTTSSQGNKCSTTIT